MKPPEIAFRRLEGRSTTLTFRVRVTREWRVRCAIATRHEEMVPHWELEAA